MMQAEKVYPVPLSRELAMKLMDWDGEAEIR